MYKELGMKRWLAIRVDQRVLRWFGHMESMDEYRIAFGLLRILLSLMQEAHLL